MPQMDQHLSNWIGYFQMFKTTFFPNGVDGEREILGHRFIDTFGGGRKEKWRGGGRERERERERD